MMQQDPIVDFISALQEISQLHCGTALSPELCLIILFRYGGMQHPFNAAMQDTEFQYTLKSFNHQSNIGCVCGLFVGKWPIVKPTNAAPAWLHDNDLWKPTTKTACHHIRTTYFTNYYYSYSMRYMSPQYLRKNKQCWGLRTERCGKAYLWYRYKLNREDHPHQPMPEMPSIEFSLVHYLRNATIERLEQDVAMFIGDPLLNNATPEEWKWLTSPHERGNQNTGYTEPTIEERQEIVRKFLKGSEPLPEVPDVSSLLSRIKTLSE